MKRVTKAVIIYKTSEVVSIYKLAVRVAERMKENAEKFPDTAEEVDTLNTEQQLLGQYIGTAKGNHVITNLRNEQAKVVHGLLQSLQHKVNVVADGDIATVGLSGFTVSSDPNPKPVPDKVIIRKIVKGKTDLSAKIFIESLKQRRLWYYVRTTSVAGAGINDPSWKEVLRTTSSKRLIISNLTHKEYVYISVNARSTAGEGMYSEAMSFCL